MQFLTRTDNKLITIEVKQKLNYGIMLSGGLDSAVLLYFIIKDFKDKKLPVAIQPFTVPKFDGSFKYVDGIIEYFNTQFDTTIPQTIIVGNPQVHHSQQNRSGVTEVLLKHPNIDYLFIGLNQNPPEPFGNINWEKPNRLTKSPNSKILLPFVDLFKTDIIDIMFQYNQEYLMNITHTCTELTIGRCNECFQCSERAWAFSELNKEDTGIL
jgi:hypothetical protein